MKRTCRKCGEKKSLDSFRICRILKGKEYRRYTCSSCMDEAAIEWRENNSLRVVAYNKDRYENNQENQIASATEWRKNNAQKRRTSCQIRYASLREEVVAAYGGCCQCCGETEPDFLCIDHINNDGYLYRKSVKNPETGKYTKTGPHTGDRLLRWLIRNDFPEGFQVLCHNCNHSKKKHGICIHQLSRFEPVTTIPKGSRAKWLEAPTIQIDLGLDEADLDDDMVSSAW